MALAHPWYSISIDVDSGEYNTHGMQEVMLLDGEEGVHVDTLESNEGMQQLLAFPLPFSWLIGLGLIYMMLSTIGLRESKKLGKKYRTAGIRLVAIVVIILVMMSMNSLLLDSTPVEIEDETGELISTVSSNPWGGDQEVDMDRYGIAQAEWGLRWGAIYLLIGGILFILAGFCEKMADTELFEKKDEKESEEKNEEKENDVKKEDSTEKKEKIENGEDKREDNKDEKEEIENGEDKREDNKDENAKNESEEKKEANIDKKEEIESGEDKKEDNRGEKVKNVENEKANIDRDNENSNEEKDELKSLKENSDTD